MFSRNLLLASILITATVDVQASPIDFSTNIIGGFIETTDAITNIQWLNLQTTLGQSFQQVASRLATGGDLMGWRYASVTEFGTMVGDYMNINTPFPQIGTSIFNVYFNAHTLANLTSAIGQTSVDYNPLIPGFPAHGYSVGLTADVDASGNNYGSSIYSTLLPVPGGPDRVSFNAFTQAISIANPTTASFLIRNSPSVSAVPIPAAGSLLLTGLLGLASLRKKRRQA